ncbi:hypothetical protein [Halomonas sp. SL1]|uniref:hypothetical protein n=1 Tax=Halomonas sp. SL1 TaxID=2137478 RepID=UPI0011B936C6|nr:hypothetical protein [Halomonas sp. SL1]
MNRADPFLNTPSYVHLNPKAFLEDLSRLAKAERTHAKQNRPIGERMGHSQCLERIAKYSGYSHWGKLREVILASGPPSGTSFLMDQSIYQRVCQGLEKAVPFAVYGYAVRDARRQLAELEIERAADCRIPPEERMPPPYPGSQAYANHDEVAIAPKIEEWYQAVFSSAVIHHVVHTLEQEGPWVDNQGDLIFEFELPGEM